MSYLMASLETENNRFSITRGYGLELMLAISVVTLVLQLAWPTLAAYVHRPRPGAIAKQRLEGEGAGGNRPIEYLLYLPLEYDSNTKTPLVVFLHGAGERGSDIEPLRGIPPIDMALQEDFPFVLAVPQCPEGSSWEASMVMPLVDELCRRFAVDQQRVYLTGYSMGGFGTWKIGAESPGCFAALMPLAGGGDPATAASLREIPISAFHGEKDEVVPVSETKTIIEAVRQAGGSPRMTIFPDMGHGGIDGRVYSDRQAWAWLLRQSLAQEPGG